MHCPPLRRLLLTLLAAACLAVIARAEPDEPGDGEAAPGQTAGPQCHLSVIFDGKDATVSFTLRSEKKAPRKEAVEKALARALSGTVKQYQQYGASGMLMASARLEGPYQPHDGAIEGTIDPAPLAELLRPLGVKEVLLHLQRSDHYRAGRVHFTRRELEHLKPQRFQIATDAPRPVHFRLAAPPPDWGRAAAIPAALVVVPVGLLLWRRRVALRSADPAAAWYGFWRWAHWVTLATWLAWFTAVPVLELDVLLERAMPGLGLAGGGLRWVATLTPPWLVMTLGAALAQEVVARLKKSEQTAREIYWRAAAGLLTGLVPLLLVLLGVVRFTEVGLGQGDLALTAGLRAAAPWLVAALAVRLLGGWLAGGEDLTPHAVTEGELRDRVFALAQQAGVTLTQFFVVPTGKMPEANAFAAQGGNVLITDHLLRSLTRREVDAVVAHELAHLKYRHPMWLLVLFLVAIFLPNLAQPLLPHWWQGTWLRHLPIGLLAALAIYHYFSRRFEYQTDDYAAWLTGDPEALITGLVKLHRLNLMPLRWGKWEEGMLTHPSTHQRLEAIARQNGVSRKRLEELVSQPDEPAEHYPVPEELSEGLIFSSAFRARYMQRSRRGLLAGALLTPALVASAAYWSDLDGAPLWALLAGGAALTLGVVMALENFLPVLAYAEAGRRLAEKLEAQGQSSAVREGTFVSFAPDGEPRLYEGFTNWDFGYLVLHAGRLSYVGERMLFSLTPDQVTDVRLGPGLPRWPNYPYLYVSWRGPDGAAGTFSLRAGAVRTMGQLARANRALEAALSQWRQQPAGAAPEAPPELPAPAFGAVTSLPVAAGVSVSGLVVQTVILTALGVGLSVLIRLPLGGDAGWLGWYVPAVAVLAVSFLQLPLWLSRKPEAPAGEPPPQPDGETTGAGA